MRDQEEGVMRDQEEGGVTSQPNVQGEPKQTTYEIEMREKKGETKGGSCQCVAM